MMAFARAIFGEPGVMLPATPEEFQVTVAEEEAVIRRHHERENAMFLLAAADDGELIGMWNALGSERRALRPSVEFGMSVARPYRGQGVGYDLLRHGIAWAKSTGIVTRLALTVYAENFPAIRLYERCGFIREGRRRHAVFQHGRYHDDLIMALSSNRGRAANTMAFSVRPCRDSLDVLSPPRHGRACCVHFSSVGASAWTSWLANPV